MDSFPAKINWKMMRKRENKKYCSVQFLPYANIKLKQNTKKIQKN